MNASAFFKEVWSRVQANDPEAARLFVHYYRSRIRNYARRQMRLQRIPIFYDPEDTCQWVLGHFLARAQTKELTFRDADHLLRYLYTMTRNRVVDLWRRHGAESSFHQQNPQPTR